MQFPKDPDMLTLEGQVGRFWWALILLTFFWPHVFHPWWAFMISVALYAVLVVFLIKIGKSPGQSSGLLPQRAATDAIKTSK